MPILPLLLALAAPAQAVSLPDAARPQRGSAALDVLHYHLQAALAPPRPRIRAVARLRMRILADRAQIVLDLHESLRVRAVAVDGRPAEFFQAEDKLFITPSVRPSLDAVARVQVIYGGQLPADVSQGEPVGLLSDGIGLVAYMEPDGAHHWFPCNDHPSDKASFDLEVTTPIGNLVGATGLLRGIQAGPGVLRYHWGTDRQVATYLVSLAAGPFDAVLRPGRIPVLDLALPGDGPKVSRNLAATPAILEFLETRFGPYPFERYGHVFTRLPVGGMENQCQTVLGRDSGISGDPLLLVHEACHQWFGDSVSPRSWTDLWLNESFATWSELLWAEHESGPAAARRVMRPWRAGTLAVARRGLPWTLAAPDPDHLFSTALAYMKGGMVLEILSEYLGRERFLAGCRTYLRRHAGGNAATRDLEQALSESCGEDLRPFFDAWVRANGLPEIRFRAEVAPREGRWRVEASGEQVQDGLPNPFVLPVRLTGGQGQTAVLPLRFSGRTTTARMEVDFEPQLVEPDADLLPVKIRR